MKHKHHHISKALRRLKQENDDGDGSEAGARGAQDAKAQRPARSQNCREGNTMMVYRTARCKKFSARYDLAV